MTHWWFYIFPFDLITKPLTCKLQKVFLWGFLLLLRNLYTKPRTGPRLPENTEAFQQSFPFGLLGLKIINNVSLLSLKRLLCCFHAEEISCDTVAVQKTCMFTLLGS